MHVIWVFPDTTEADTIWYTQYRLRYDTDPIIVRSLLSTSEIWTYKNRNRTGAAAFIKKRPKLTTNPKMETVTALLLYKEYSANWKCDKRATFSLPYTNWNKIEIKQCFDFSHLTFDIKHKKNSRQLQNVLAVLFQLCGRCKSAWLSE